MGEKPLNKGMLDKTIQAIYQPAYKTSKYEKYRIKKMEAGWPAKKEQKSPENKGLKTFELDYATIKITNIKI